MSPKPLTIEIHPFRLDGTIEVGDAGMFKAVGAARPTRPLNGWLTTFGHIGPSGGVIPTVDRDDQVMDAARELGHIDWTHYLSKGAWNDTHNETVIVGRSLGVEFHDGRTPLSKAYGNRIGFWTRGVLFDRADPASFGPFRPSAASLDRSDHFWQLATLLKSAGVPRTLGLSAHGRMAMSPCKKRILWAEITQAAVCETPVNPAATLELAKGSDESILGLALRKGGAGRISDESPCKTCSCPPGGCQLVRVNKAVVASSITAVVPQDLEGVTNAAVSLDDDSTREQVLRRLMQRYSLDRATAEKWLRAYIARQEE